MDAQYLYSLIEDTLKIIEGWESDVVQVVTDNEENFKAAGKILQEKMPHIVWGSCAAHRIDLMLQDIGKLEDVQKQLMRERWLRA